MVSYLWVTEVTTDDACSEEENPQPPSANKDAENNQASQINTEVVED